MASMSFQVNDASASTTNPAVWVTISENANGTLSFNLTQTGGIVGDLRGVFFDLADESLLGSLIVNAASSDIRSGNDTIKDLGDGANMNGLLGSDKGYDVGIEIGSSGIGKDDIQSYSFTLGSSARALSLADFSQVDFGVRLTSVGTLGGARGDSSKLLETTSLALDLQDRDALVVENHSSSGNLLAGIQLPGSTVLTGWSGGSLGSPLQLTSGSDLLGTLTLNNDGSYLLDAGPADRLSAGEEIVYTYNYSARNQDEATSWSSDSASFTVRVIGTNDGPVANDDQGGCVDEDQTLNGSVTANDSDIDRLDTHSWALVENSFSGLGQLQMNADGSWTYDAQGAYDYLNAGEQVELSFQYTMTDNHGASDTATVTFCIDGVGDVLPPPPPPPPPPTGNNFFPVWGQDISHFTLVFDQTQGDVKPRPSGDGYYTVKIDVPGSFNDDLDASLANVLAALRVVDSNVTASSPLIGAVIKGGLQITSYFAYGSHDSNGSASDTLPADLGFILRGDNSVEYPTSAIDAAYDYDTLMLLGVSSSPL